MGAVRPKTVLHVLNSAAGGAALSTIALMRSLELGGISSCAVCHDAGTDAERDQIRDATGGRTLLTPLYWWNRKIRAALWKRPLIELRQILHTGWMRRSSAAIADFAHQHNADLIHTNTFLIPEGGIAARRLGVPHVWHLRELLGPRQPFRLAGSPAKTASYVREHASLVIANSETTASTAGEWIPADMIRVVPNGIDVAAFQQRPHRANASQPLVIAMVASLTSRTKKHDLFVEAAARLKSCPGVEFRIYGHDLTAGGIHRGDRYAESIHSLVRQRGLADRLHFPGYLPDPVRIMGEIDILVHPADNESFGRIVVEAMAAGLPVVGVRGGGVGEIVVDGETGLLAPPDNPSALAECISKLVHDEALQNRLGAAGRCRAESHFSLESCVAGVLRAYEEAMQRPLGTRQEAPRS